jgi:molybdenum cofactor cytidylyltransferase
LQKAFLFWSMQLHHALHLQPREVIAFVGGGGKTTAMFQLANELAPTHRVLTTTTTRIFAAQIQRAPAYIAFDSSRQTIAEILPQLNQAIDQHGQVLLIGQVDHDKAFGVAPEVIDALALTGQFDTIINEADGSRMRPFKAPADHEPVIPACTTLVIPVVGLDILGQPLTADMVHRAELVSQLSNTPLGAPVTVETIAAVLTHPLGGLKNVPSAARVMPLLNKFKTFILNPTPALGVLSPTDVGGIKRGRLAAPLLRHPKIEAVLLAELQQRDSPVYERHGRIAAIILAAGGSSRFGSPKQLARWGDKTFLEQAVEVALAAGMTQVIVVLGAEVAQSQELLRKYEVQIALNPAWAEGQSTSMHAGLRALADNVQAAMFMLVDLPQLTPAVLQAVIQRYQQTGAPLVWPEFNGKRGNPVLFDRTLFAELMTVQGDTGGRPILQAHQAQAERVDVTEAGILYDIDHASQLVS